MKTETSFHCNTCGRCVEHFDHHCPFINNCLGYRNHKYFMVFICSYAIFLICIMLETIRHVFEICFFDSNVGTVSECLKDEVFMFVIFVLVLCHMPIIFYQLYS